MSWSMLSVSTDSHTLTARAHDATEHVTTSSPVTVQVKERTPRLADLRSGDATL
jgi:hypothetical protein